MAAIRLEQIENERRISPETDSEFLYEYQKALLLSLLESEYLTREQYHCAKEKLRQQKTAPQRTSGHLPDDAEKEIRFAEESR